MAITNWPRFNFLESPSGAAGKVTGSTMRISARSVSGSSPTSRAVRCWPSGVVTSMRAEELAVLPAPATWLLVRMSPSGATTTPEPQPSLFTRVRVVEAELQTMKALVADLKEDHEALREDRDEWRWRAEYLLAEAQKGFFGRWGERIEAAVKPFARRLNALI